MVSTLSEISTEYFSEAQICAWIAKRISKTCWATKERYGKFKMAPTKSQVKAKYASLRLGLKPKFWKKYTHSDLMYHFTGAVDFHFCSSDDPECQETIACIDIDCHGKGSYEGAVEFATYLRVNYFPNLFFSRSTNGRGVHAYIRVAKGSARSQLIIDSFQALETFLRWVLKTNAFDVEGVEVKGQPPKYVWGDEKYDLVSHTQGRTGRLPVEALERPAELMNTTLVSLSDMSELGCLARSKSREAVDISGLKGKELVKALVDDVVEEITEDLVDRFGEIDTEDMTTSWLPEMRHGEWVFWLEKMAKVGLQEEDSMPVVIGEMARWLLHVELYDSPDRQTETVELLQTFIMGKHNGYVSRLKNGKIGEADVMTHVERLVKQEMTKQAESAQLFLRIRQKRKSGQYVNLINIAHLLGEQVEETEERSAISCSTYVMHSDDLLPSEIEALLIGYAKSQGMQKRQGDYPFIRFSRDFLRHLWSRKGSGRVHSDALLSLTGKNVKRLMIFKNALLSLRLIQDWQGTHNSKSHSSIYKLTDKAKQAFEAEYKASVKVG